RFFARAMPAAWRSLLFSSSISATPKSKVAHICRTSGSTGIEISGRDLIGKRPLHRLIDFAASELENYQKGCRKLQGWKPAKSRSFLQRFGRSERKSFLIEKLANALPLGQLVRLDSAPLVAYR